MSSLIPLKLRRGSRAATKQTPPGAIDPTVKADRRGAALSGLRESVVHRARNVVSYRDAVARARFLVGQNLTARRRVDRSRRTVEREPEPCDAIEASLDGDGRVETPHSEILKSWFIQSARGATAAEALTLVSVPLIKSDICCSAFCRSCGRLDLLGQGSPLAAISGRLVSFPQRGSRRGVTRLAANAALHAPAKCSAVDLQFAGKSAGRDEHDRRRRVAVDGREAHKLALVLLDVVSVEHQPTAYSGRLGKS